MKDFSGPFVCGPRCKLLTGGGKCHGTLHACGWSGWSHTPFRPSRSYLSMPSMSSPPHRLLCTAGPDHHVGGDASRVRPLCLSFSVSWTRSSLANSSPSLYQTPPPETKPRQQTQDSSSSSQRAADARKSTPPHYLFTCSASRHLSPTSPCNLSPGGPTNASRYLITHLIMEPSRLGLTDARQLLVILKQ